MEVVQPCDWLELLCEESSLPDFVCGLGTTNPEDSAYERSCSVIWARRSICEFIIPYNLEHNDP